MEDKRAAAESVKAVFSRVLPRIKPTPEEERADALVAQKVAERIKPALPRGAEVKLVGSVAKGTQARGDNDVDVFILFPKSGFSRADLETLGLKIAKAGVTPGAKWETRYAEHPYLKTEVDGIEVEIVPAFKAASAAEGASAADRSPFHTEYVLKHLPPERRDDVRLLKRFLKRLSVYGAEVKVEGFSGYLCELLAIHAGSAEKLLREAAGWNEPAIDTARHYASPAQARQRFPGAPLVVVDPVDKNRNVAAAVSLTSLSKFILASRAFLANPGEEFFFETPPKLGRREIEETRRALAGKGTPRVLALEFRAPDTIPDILWPQLRRAARTMFERLESAGFQVFDYGYWTDEKKWCAIAFELLVADLPAIEKVCGPKIQFASGAQDFARKHRNPLAGPWVGGDRLYAARKRRFTTAKALAAHIIAHPKEYAIPAKIAGPLSKARFLTATGLLKKRYLRFALDYAHKRHYYIEAL
jgi:tRNA nucleotidyltransferase (CCA-adding enzyme)